MSARRGDPFRCGVGFIVVAAVALVCAGCGGRRGPPRYPVTGAVTYAGRPLAAGRIAFEPETARGNRGPAGYGDIVNGRYTTYRTMGAVGGPHRVVIEGYAGDSPEQWRKRRPLFPVHVTTVELPTGAATVDFDVPAAAPPDGTPPRDAP